MNTTNNKIAIIILSIILSYFLYLIFIPVDNGRTVAKNINTANTAYYRDDSESDIEELEEKISDYEDIFYDLENCIEDNQLIIEDIQSVAEYPEDYGGYSGFEEIQDLAGDYTDCNDLLPL